MKENPLATFAIAIFLFCLGYLIGGDFGGFISAQGALLPLYIYGR